MEWKGDRDLVLINSTITVSSFCHFLAWAICRFTIDFDGSVTLQNSVLQGSWFQVKGESVTIDIDSVIE